MYVSLYGYMGHWVSSDVCIAVCLCIGICVYCMCVRVLVCLCVCVFHINHSKHFPGLLENYQNSNGG